MNELELSRSMSRYTEMFGEPDDATTVRMRERVRTTIDVQERRGVRNRHWAQAAVAVGVAALLLGGLLFFMHWRAGAANAGVLEGGEAGQQVELADGGLVALEPGATVRVDHTLGRIELLGGRVRVETEGSLEVRCGPYRVALAPGAALDVRRTESLPIVEVAQGEAVLRGPDLPATGITLRPLGASRVPEDF